MPNFSVDQHLPLASINAARLSIQNELLVPCALAWMCPIWSVTCFFPLILLPPFSPLVRITMKSIMKLKLCQCLVTYVLQRCYRYAFSYSYDLWISLSLYLMNIGSGISTITRSQDESVYLAWALWDWVDVSVGLPFLDYISANAKKHTRCILMHWDRIGSKAKSRRWKHTYLLSAVPISWCLEF